MRMDGCGSVVEERECGIMYIYPRHNWICIIVYVIGIDMLTNVQRGHVYGNVCGWRMCKRRKLGVHLLHKAFRTYQIHMPQELFLCDL